MPTQTVGRRPRATVRNAHVPCLRPGRGLRRSGGIRSGLGLWCVGGIRPGHDLHRAGGIRPRARGWCDLVALVEIVEELKQFNVKIKLKRRTHRTQFFIFIYICNNLSRRRSSYH